MEKLKALEGAVQAIHHQLLSFDLLEHKSQQLTQYLQIIRNLLPLNSPEDFVSMLEGEKVQPAEEVQLRIQEFQIALSRIIRFLKAKVSTPMAMAALSEKDSEFDLKCLELVTSAVNLIITNCSGMTEFVSVLTVGENDDWNSNSWALPDEGLSNLTPWLDVLPNAKKRKNNSEDEVSGSENNVLLKQQLDENGERAKKKPKPKPPMEEALENDVVLREIFRHSSPENLLSFRLVNRKWNETATSALLIKNCLEIVIDGKYEAFFSDSTSSSSTSSSSSEGEIRYQSYSHGSLTDLRCLIEGSSKFPTKSLKFKVFSRGLDPELEQLLRTLGNEIKEVTLTHSSKVSFSFLRELLLNLTPNLESLRIDSCFLSVRNGQNENRLITGQNGVHPVGSGRISSLPNLKLLYFEPWDSRYLSAEPGSDHLLHMEFFKELFNAATNLCSVRALTVDFLEVVLDSGRAQLINELTYEPFLEKKHDRIVDGSAVETYEKFCSMRPEITKLCISLRLNNQGQFPSDHEKKSVVELTLNSVLEFNKDRLRSLKIESLEDFSIDLPVLPKVRQLTVCSNFRVRHELNAVLPTNNPTFSFQNNFPHLHELDLYLSSFNDYDMESYFPGELAEWLHPTVKQLTLRGGFCYSRRREDVEFAGAQMLGEMFPNVTSVVFIYDEDDYSLYTSPLLWHLIPAGVKSLRVTGLPNERNCDFGLDKDEEFVRDVDSFFTGIPVEICSRLRKWPQRTGGEQESIIPDVLRTQRSVCDLKNLEELNLSFNDFQSGRLFASHVTGLYAFDLMPKLNVTITYKPKFNRPTTISNKTPSEDMNSCLELIAPYVTQICNHKSYYYWWLKD